MSNVSKHIKKLRLAAKMTQDELGERLHVTRQAVSNWETGRTQPDLEMLHSIADVFGTDEMELIYGRKAAVEKPEAYPQNKNVRIGVTLLFGVLTALSLLIRLIWLPESLTHYYYKFQQAPLYLSMLLARPFFAASVSLFGLSLLSVWKDIRIKNPTSQRLFLIIAAVCLLFYYGGFLLTFLGAGSIPFQLMFHFLVALLYNPEYIFFAVGITAFLGFNH